MQLNPFNAQTTAEEDLRSTGDVFKSSVPKPADDLKARFGSSGSYTTSQLEQGADLVGGLRAGKSADAAAAEEEDEQPAESEPQFDPDDSRSLYDRLKEQKDQKQEEYEEKHKFKNQMDHWRLDDDDAAFEEERVEKQAQQQALAARQHEEGKEFYKLARATQERPLQPPPKPRAAADPPSKKRPAGPLGAIKVVKAQKGAAAAPAPVAPADAPAPKPAAAAALPGMGAYSDSDDDE
jgi:hypothetical protein